MLELLKSRDISTPKKEDEAYHFPVAAYRERHRGAAVLATETEGPLNSRQEGEWLFPTEIAVTIVGASILIAAAEFLRRRSERLAKERSPKRRRMG